MTQKSINKHGEGCHFQCTYHETLAEIVEHSDGNFDGLSADDRVRQGEGDKERLEGLEGGHGGDAHAFLGVGAEAAADPLCDGVWHLLGHGHFTPGPGKLDRGHTASASGS